jgi:hypothetical protein
MPNYEPVIGYYLDIQIVDPDFDDEWPSICSMQHDIDAHGAVGLHPDDSRLNYDPVPLCSWSYYDEGEKRKKAEEHKRYLVEREEYLQKRKASEEWWSKPAEERRIIEEAWLAEQDLLLVG